MSGTVQEMEKEPESSALSDLDTEEAVDEAPEGSAAVTEDSDSSEQPEADSSAESTEASAAESVEESVEDDSLATDDESSEAEDSLENLETRYQEALAEAEKFKDIALRSEAEMQNIRRRADRNVENAHKYGLERIVTNILPVLDGMEKTLESDTGKDDPVIQGARLTFKLLQDVLTKESVEVIDPVGEPFDPNEHEAMTVVENPDMEPNSVFAVVQKGYKLNQRLLRPAMVMVTKVPADTDP